MPKTLGKEEKTATQRLLDSHAGAPTQNTCVKKELPPEDGKNNHLLHLIMHFRFNTVARYADKYAARIRDSRRDIMSVLYRLLASEQWSLPKALGSISQSAWSRERSDGFFHQAQRIIPIIDNRLSEYDGQLIKLFRDDFLNYFNKENTVVNYVLAVGHQLLSDFNSDNNQDLIWEELPFYPFTEKEKESYLKLFTSFGLEDECDCLFTKKMEAEAVNTPQYTLNTLELFSCIALKLYEHRMVEGTLKLELAAEISDEASDFTVDGVCFLRGKKLIEAMKLCLNSDENDLEALIPEFMQRIERAVDDQTAETSWARSKDSKFWDNFFGLSNALKAFFCRLLEEDQKRWNDFILLATERDKDFLRYFILSQDSLFFDAFSEQNYVILCVLFAKETDVLNALLNTQYFREVAEFSQDQKVKIASALDPFFLEENYLNWLKHSFEQNTPGSDAIRLFIANYCPAVYGKLLDDARSEPDQRRFISLIQYVPHDERSFFPGLVAVDELFRKRYIDYLTQAIAQGDTTLFGLLTDWELVIDAEGSLQLPPLFYAFSQDSNCCADLINLCIESKRYDFIKTLMCTKGVFCRDEVKEVGQVNTLLVKHNPEFRQQFINFLSQAVETCNVALFELLIGYESLQINGHQLETEHPLQVLVATEPVLYARLLGLSAAHQGTHTVFTKLLSFVDLELGHSGMEALYSELKNNEQVRNSIDSCSRLYPAARLLTLDKVDQFIMGRVVDQNYQELSQLCAVAEYAFDNPKVRETLIDVLSKAIIKNDPVLVDALTNDSRKIASLAHHLFAQEVPHYARLITLCIEHENNILLKQLLINEHTVSIDTLRALIIDRLTKAVINNDTALFDTLIMSNDNPPSSLYSNTLFAICDKAPKEYQALIRQCSERKQVSMLKKLTASQFPKSRLYTHSDLTDINYVSNERLRKSLLLALGADKVDIQCAKLDGKNVHVVYCAKPNNDEELLGQFNELALSLKSRSQHVLQGLGCILTPKGDSISAIIYVAPKYEHTLERVLRDSTIDTLQCIHYFIKHLLRAIQTLHQSNIALSSAALAQHVFIYRAEDNMLNAILVNNSHLSLENNTSSPWLSDFIFELGLLPLQRLAEKLIIDYPTYLRIRDSLRARDGKGLAFLDSLRCSPESNGLLEFMSMAVAVTNSVSIDIIDCMVKILDKKGSLKFSEDTLSNALQKLGEIAPVDEHGDETKDLCSETAGAVVLCRNTIEAIHRYLSSGKHHPDNLVATYLRCLEVAVFNADHQKINDCLSGLSDELKRQLFYRIADKNAKLCGELVMWTMDHDKKFLRGLILASDNLFFKRLSEDFDIYFGENTCYAPSVCLDSFHSYYPDLCSLFVSDFEVLNILLGIPFFQKQFAKKFNNDFGARVERAIRGHFLKEEHFNEVAQWFANPPMNKNICSFIANYSPLIYGRLLENAFRESPKEHFAQLIQYIPHNEPSCFSRLVLTDKPFRTQYISYLAWAIAQGDKVLFRLLTDWNYIPDANGFHTSTPMFSATTDPEGYAGLIKQCIEDNQNAMLQVLVDTGGWLNDQDGAISGQVNDLVVSKKPLFRELYVALLHKAAVIKAPLFETLIHHTARVGKRQFNASPLQIVLETRPEDYARLLELCITHQSHMVLTQMIDVLQPHLNNPTEQSQALIELVARTLKGNTASHQLGVYMEETAACIKRGEKNTILPSATLARVAAARPSAATGGFFDNRNKDKGNRDKHGEEPTNPIGHSLESVL